MNSDRYKLLNIAYIFLIVECVCLPVLGFIIGLINIVGGLLLSAGGGWMLVVTGIIVMIFLILPLAWLLPMTLKIKQRRSDDKDLTALGVCTLIFANIVSGILILVATSKNNQKVVGVQNSDQSQNPNPPIQDLNQ